MEFHLTADLAVLAVQSIRRRFVLTVNGGNVVRLVRGDITDVENFVVFLVGNRVKDKIADAGLGSILDIPAVIAGGNHVVAVLDGNGRGGGECFGKRFHSLTAFCRTVFTVMLEILEVVAAERLAKVFVVCLVDRYRKLGTALTSFADAVIDEMIVRRSVVISERTFEITVSVQVIFGIK